MTKPFPLVLAALLGASLCLVGCGDNMADDGLTKKDQETVSRIDQIAKASGGDWEKVPQADRDYLLKEVTMGSEQSAKMLLQSKVHKPGGPPAAGGPPANR